MAGVSLNRFMRASVFAALIAASTYALPAHADALLALRLQSAPHAPEPAPDLMVHIPTRFTAQKPVHVLIFLHGFSSCVRALIASEPTPCTPGDEPRRAYKLAEIHEAAHANSILLVPQLAFLARDSNAPRFASEGGFDAFMRDVQQQLADKFGANKQFASITLIAHSAGYKAAAAILSDPQRETPIANVVLFDALYANWDVFAAFILGSPNRRLISLFTRDHKTTRGNLNLAALVRKGRRISPERRAGVLEQERVDTPHGLVPTWHLAHVLDSL